eukprot:526136-Amphidinium_carterae.2
MHYRLCVLRDGKHRVIDVCMHQVGSIKVNLLPPTLDLKLSESHLHGDSKCQSRKGLPCWRPLELVMRCRTFLGICIKPSARAKGKGVVTFS